ncbi:protein FAM13A-like protein [Leptotrombidium deliense]|uniref:Protein FAM13A-like protein n=1 Tax=Leptotrombidium deliense TaxID=299467 RepID=A0A443SV96_9ACAR|nr:protein FAM13A-like protein [Leptotrombidium deliense]
MKARMRRLSASVDAAILDHGKHSDELKFCIFNHSDSGESRIERVRRLISSPLTRRKSTCSPGLSSAHSKSDLKVFGTPLEIVAHQEFGNIASQKEPSIPYVMSRLCNFIEDNNGLQFEGLFRTSGNAKLIEKLRTTFDSEGDAPLETDGDIPAAAALLKLFLRELPDSLIPSSMHFDFLNSVRGFAVDKENTVCQLQGLVGSLPDENYFMLKYLSNFLRRVASQESHNRMNPGSLGIVFGPNIFRVSTDDYKGLKEQALTNQIVSLFISEYETIFEGKRKVSLSLLSRFNTLPPLHVDIPSTEIQETFLTVSSHSIKSEASFKSEMSFKSHVEDSNLPILMIDDLSIINTQSGRKRKERKLLGFHSPALRSSSEERNINESKKSLIVSDMRRCSSHENVLPTEDVKTDSPLISTSPHPPHAKRREMDSVNDFQSTSSRRLQQRSVEREVHRFSEQKTVKMCDREINYLSFDGKEPTDSLKENEYKLHNESEAKSYIQTHPMFNVSNVDNKQTEFNLKESVSNTPQNSVLREIPAFDLNTLHQNADGCEPIISEHRYSWPSLNGNWQNTSAEDVNNSMPTNPSSYPLLQHSSLQVLKKANSYEAPLSPSAYRGFLSHRVAHLDETIPPSPPVEQQEIFLAKKNTTISETAAMKDLKKRISSLKKKVKQFENEFEQENGYRPSQEQKLNSCVCRPILLELNKHRKDLKELKEDSRLELRIPTNRDVWCNSDIQIVTAKRRESNDFDFDVFPTCGEKSDVLLENVLCEIQKRLKEKREKANRPDDVEEMSTEQILDEKLDVQKALLKYESLFGRPESKEDRDVMRPIYDRYRTLKRLASRFSSKTAKKDSTELQPILEHVAMNFSSPGPQSNLHELPFFELLKEMQETATEKKHLRKVIKTFEEDFQKKMGRKVEKEDRVHLETVYVNYKHVKGKLRLMEALVAKNERSRIRN